MSNIVLYSSEFCPYCRRARALLDRKGVTYVGGCDDLVALDRRGELDSLLNPL